MDINNRLVGKALMDGVNAVYYSREIAVLPQTSTEFLKANPERWKAFGKLVGSVRNAEDQASPEWWMRLALVAWVPDAMKEWGVGPDDLRLEDQQLLRTGSDPMAWVQAAEKLWNSPVAQVAVDCMSTGPDGWYEATKEGEVMYTPSVRVNIQAPQLKPGDRIKVTEIRHSSLIFQSHPELELATNGRRLTPVVPESTATGRTYRGVLRHASRGGRFEWP